MTIGEFIANRFSPRLNEEFAGYTVSQGTDRPEDLLPNFLGFLEDHIPLKAQEVTWKAIEEGWPWAGDKTKAFPDYYGLLYPRDFPENLREKGKWIIDMLSEILSQIAPEGCCFGVQGQDLGFWEVA